VSHFLKFKPKEAGFTLVEVVVVLSILATVITFSTILFYEGIRYVETSKVRNQAIALAEQKIENIRNTDYDSISTTEPNPLEDTKNLSNVTFTRNVDVAASPSDIPSSNDDIKKITVTVSWTDTAGSKSVRLVTYRARQL